MEVGFPAFGSLSLPSLADPIQALLSLEVLRQVPDLT
jgi:hypothetical protein